MKTIIVILISLFYTGSAFAEVRNVPIGTSSSPSSAELRLDLIARFQSYNASPKNHNDFYDPAIDSPKSALILRKRSENKLYVNSLEGCLTRIYDLNTYKKIGVIRHEFDESNANLFLETQFHDYHFRTRQRSVNIFKGKPVEMCLSHNGKYLWIPYYRRHYDLNAIDPSALAIVNTETDTIVRVMPTAPLPKMIACSPDNKYIAVSNWGDNTVHLIAIDSDNPSDFRYVKHFEVEHRLTIPDTDKELDRDHYCGYCLRATIFTPDSKYLLVGRMGGGGIAFFDIGEMSYMGTVFGMKENLRHLMINGNTLYLSSNKTGYVQKTDLNALTAHALRNKYRNSFYSDWQSCFSGIGARTIVSDSSGKYLFATAHIESKITVIRTDTMKVIARVAADSYPVGMAISPDNDLLIVTSQGREDGGGNSVMIFKISYQK